MEDSIKRKSIAELRDEKTDSEENITETDSQLSSNDSDSHSEELGEVSGSRSKSLGSNLVIKSYVKKHKKKNYGKNHSDNINTETPHPSDDISSSESDGVDSDEDGKDDHEKASRSELLKIMKEDHKTMISTITQAAKADIEKGKAVKAQRLIFDSLLNMRISLQKALIAINSMAVTEFKSTNQLEDEPYDAAEVAATRLWNRLYDFRHKMTKANSPHQNSLKRKHVTDLTAPSPIMWGEMQNLDMALNEHRQKTLEKWSSKVSDTMAIPLSEKFRQQNRSSFTSVTLDQLTNSEQLVRRTKIPRSCAPIQRELKLTEDPNIYDDGNFYQILLKELLEQRKAESLHLPVSGKEENKPTELTGLKENKIRKVVDTKASKGRKLRFTVHEKLQNFAAPQDRGSWEQMAVDRLFSSLLGQKIVLDEGEDETKEDYFEPEESLKLFRS